MSNKGISCPKLDLELNLSPPSSWISSTYQQYHDESSPKRSSVSSDSIISVSSSLDNNRPTEAKAMVLVGCPQCLMYVMLSEDDEVPKCPKCKTTVLLEISP